MLIELQRRNDIPRNVLTRMFLLGAGYTVDGAIGAFRARLLMNAKLDPARGAGWWTNDVRKMVLAEIAGIEWSVKR